MRIACRSLTSRFLSANYSPDGDVRPLIVVDTTTPVPGNRRPPSNAADLALVARRCAGRCRDTRQGGGAGLAYQFSGEVSTLLTIPASPSRPIGAMRLAVASWEQTRASRAAFDVEHQRTADW